jgi:hypothetical protein
VNLDNVILQLKEYCPFFKGNVAGSAAWERGVEDQVWLPTPAAYVVPLDGDASENQDQGAGIYQVLTERVNVIVQFDNSHDRRGQSVTTSYEPVKYILLAALYGWRPDSSIDNPGLVVPGTPGADVSVRGMTLAGHGFVFMDLARLFYRWTFQLDMTLTDADGWQPPSEPLLGVQANYPDPDGTTHGEPFEVTLPQT